MNRLAISSLLTKEGGAAFAEEIQSLTKEIYGDDLQGAVGAVGAEGEVDNLQDTSKLDTEATASVESENEFGGLTFGEFMKQQGVKFDG